MKRIILYKNTTLAAVAATAAVAMSCLTFQSCEDFLTVYPTDAITEGQFWQDKNDLNFVRAAAYKKLTDHDRYTPIDIYEGPLSKLMCWGEFRTDNMVLNTRDATDIIRLQDAVLMPTASMFNWSEFYQGINYCNMVLVRGQRMLENNVDPSFAEGEWRPIKAEMHALRALYYFYLVRAFRDVPYVSVPVETDEEALDARIAATPGIAIIGDLIDSLEVVQNSAAVNFGSRLDNKGRFTKLGVRTLLADLYLWRGCMLQNHFGKMREGVDSIVNLSDVMEDGVLKTADGTVINESYLSQESQRCFQQCISYCDMALDYMKDEYQKELDKMANPSPLLRSQPYPLTQFELPSVVEAATDFVYDELFSRKNSDESIFEVQFDGSSNVNGILGNYLSSYSSRTLTAQKLSVNPALAAVSAVELESGFGRGFGKTDVRLLETMAYEKGNSTVYPYVKNIAEQVTITNVRDMSEGASYSYRSASSQNANWPIYRLSDLMLIKAEAIARTANASSTALNEGFDMLNSLFARYNPGATVEDGEWKSIRLGGYDLVNGTFDRSSAAYFGTNKNAAQLLLLVYRERQREFVGEGKFWFDIVREAESTNDPALAISSYISIRSEVKARLRNIYSLYCPIYTEEMKVNGVKFGGKLVQNPVWDRYSSN